MSDEQSAISDQRIAKNNILNEESDILNETDKISEEGEI